MFEFLAGGGAIICAGHHAGGTCSGTCSELGARAPMKLRIGVGGVPCIGSAFVRQAARQWTPVGPLFRLPMVDPEPGQGMAQLICLGSVGVCASFWGGRRSASRPGVVGIFPADPAPCAVFPGCRPSALLLLDWIGLGRDVHKQKGQKRGRKFLGVFCGIRSHKKERSSPDGSAGVAWRNL